MNAITKAIKICGTQSKLAAACGVTQAWVSNWANGATIKAEHAIKIERATNKQVTRAELRPDIFGSEAA